MRICSLLLSAATISLLLLPSTIAAETLTIGTINENIKKNIARFSHLPEELQLQLANDGITEIEVRILRRWNDGVAAYHSVIVARSDSGINSLEDLPGRRIGFQDADSTSGFMLPVGLIIDNDIEILELPSREAMPATDQIGYVFTGDDNNTLGWIYRDWIDAAATDPQSFADLSATAPGDFHIIARSTEVPRQVAVQARNTDPEIVARLVEVLTTMHETEHDRSVLQRFNDTDRIDQSPDGIQATFDPIYRILDRLVEQGIL